MDFNDAFGEERRRGAHWTRPTALLFVAALIVATATHVATFWGIDATLRYPWLWALHAVAIGGVGALVLAARSRYVGGAMPFPPPGLPRWAPPLLTAAFAYTIVNFGLFMIFHGARGAPHVRDGVYALTDHGRVLRTLTASEYRWERAWLVRGFSGHWILFLLVPTLFFLYDDAPSSRERS